jgi:hypothetical protein
MLLAVGTPTAVARPITAFWQPNVITQNAISADPALGGMQSWSLMAKMDGNWASAAMEAILPTGNVFYNPTLGGNTRPNPELVVVHPNLAFDTYVTCPLDTGTSGAPVILGFAGAEPGPGDFGGTTGRFSIAWGNLVVDPPGTFEIARLTFPLGPYINLNPTNTTSQISPDSTTLIPPVPLPRVNWTLDADGSWHVPGNWSSSPLLPGPADNVLIDVGGDTIRTITHSVGSTKVRSIDSFEKLVLNGGTLEVTDLIRNRGGLEISGGTLVGAGVSWQSITFGAAGGRLVRVSTNSGLEVPANTTVVVNEGLTIGHTILRDGAILRLQGTQELDAWGTLRFDSGSTLQIDGGTAVSTTFGNLLGTGGVIGQRTPGTSGQTTLVNRGRVWASGGSLVFEADTLVNAGTIGPNTSGSIVVNGSVFSSTGIVEMPASSTITVNASFVASGGTVGGNGVVRANNTMTVNGPVKKTGTGVLRVNRTISVGPAAALDFAAGNIVNDYLAGTPIADFRAAIASGHAGGTWVGPGINSSTAAATPGIAVGYAEASAIFPVFPATFAGETIDDTTIVLRLTRYGDADLSGQVNLADFNRLAAHFNRSGVWSDGDFNYDGVVNLPDFNLLAANFNLSASPDGPTPQDWANLAAAVPEPGALALFLALPMCLRRAGKRVS